MKAFIALAMAFLAGQLYAYTNVVLSGYEKPAEVAECAPPPEVQRLADLMASMPLNIVVTEPDAPPVPLPGTKPDQIALLINNN